MTDDSSGVDGRSGGFEGNTVGMLRRYERLLTESGAPIAKYLAAGYSGRFDAPDDALQVPDDLRQWWGRHNGTTVRSADGRDLFLDHSYWFYSYEEALEERRWIRVIAEETNPEDADDFFRSGWLPVGAAGGRDRLLVNCTPGELNTVIGWYGEVSAAENAQLTDSWADFISWNVELLELGARTYDGATNSWHLDTDKAPPRYLGQFGPWAI